MVDSFLLAFSVLLVIVGSAHAQVTAPNCADSTLSWTLNSLSQSPCVVGAFLAAVCNNGSFTIPTLLPQHSYTGPSGPDDGDLCKCNTVFYNLISACDACQGEPWVAYSAWTFNCSSVAAARIFPEAVPAGTRVPKWAYLDSTASDSWNITAAQLAGDSPEVTGTTAIVPTSTKNSQSTVTPQTTSSAPNSSNSSSKGSSNKGAIAGGVVGGLIGAAIIAGLVSWFTIRRRRASSAPSAAYIDGQSGMGEATAPYPLGIEAPRLYDPSDPSTYPTTHAPSPTIHTTNYSGQFPSSASDLQTVQQVYSGLPEV